MKFNKATVAKLKAKALEQELKKRIPFESGRSTWFFQLPKDEQERDRFLAKVRNAPAKKKNK